MCLKLLQTASDQRALLTLIIVRQDHIILVPRYALGLKRRMNFQKP